MGEAIAPDRAFLQHDVRLRAAARALYEIVYPGEEWAPVPFEEAERTGSVHYRQAVEAVQRVRLLLTADNARQLPLL